VFLKLEEKEAARRFKEKIVVPETSFHPHYFLVIKSLSWLLVHYISLVPFYEGFVSSNLTFGTWMSQVAYLSDLGFRRGFMAQSCKLL